MRPVAPDQAPTEASGGPAPAAIRGRGAPFNPPNRFEEIHPEWDPDLPPEERPAPRTQFFVDASESVLVHNESPDVGFAWGLNPYRGCEHGCAYCYARPYHEYLGWGSGLDFETRILVKTRAPELLRGELAAPRWKPQVIGLSGVTDCYQPAERQFRITRRCLEVMAECRQAVSVVTKNFLITRDLDLLAELGRFQAVSVAVSLTTLDADLAARLAVARHANAGGRGHTGDGADGTRDSRTQRSRDPGRPGRGFRGRGAARRL